MPHQLSKLTPNLIVTDVSRSVAFYRDVLGFHVELTVPPDAEPYVFASVQSGPIEIFLNAPEPAYAEYPSFKDRRIGGTLTLFIEVVDVTGLHEAERPGDHRHAARAQMVWSGGVCDRGSRRLRDHVCAARRLVEKSPPRRTPRIGGMYSRLPVSSFPPWWRGISVATGSSDRASA